MLLSALISSLLLNIVLTMSVLSHSREYQQADTRLTAPVDANAAAHKPFYPCIYLPKCAQARELGFDDYPPLYDNLGCYSYPITTNSPMVQRSFDYSGGYMASPFGPALIAAAAAVLGGHCRPCPKHPFGHPLSRPASRSLTTAQRQAAYTLNSGR
jgi:hypothetical protein